MADRAALVPIAQAEQLRLVAGFKATIAASADPAERERLTTRMHDCDRAWAWIVVWLQDKVCLPADIAWMHRYAVASRKRALAAWRKADDQTNAHPMAAHWIGLIDIEDAILFGVIGPNRHLFNREAA